jgi:predicted DCC family thiol-disulfide oxidoreductase YuxK
MSSTQDILLVYDKECPACNYYCNLTRIRESLGDLVLVNARDGGPVMDEITAAGLDIDQGMVLKVGDKLHYGSDAIHALSLMSTRSGIFNRLSCFIFRSEKVSAVLYPVLLAGRNLLLKSLRKSKINNLESANNDRF